MTPDDLDLDPLLDEADIAGFRRGLAIGGAISILLWPMLYFAGSLVLWVMFGGSQ